MKICLIGNSQIPDEGQKRVALSLYKALDKRHQVLFPSVWHTLSPNFWKALKHFEPEIIHYIPGPSLKSFIITKVLAYWSRKPKTIMWAIHPCFSSTSGKFIPWFKPDLVLTQSHATEQFFKNIGCKTKFLPIGVDSERFAPASKETKQRLRGKYRLDKEKFIILHIGSLRKGRNVYIFGALQEGSNQVLIVGRSARTIELIMNYKRNRTVEMDIYQYLKQKGCIIKTEYLKDIEEMYALSDCYIFPTVNPRESIEMPLSVIEAMSCNLPVISTKFGSLPRVFEEGDGLYFADKEEDFVHLVDKIKAGNIEVRTREKVLPYSWDNIANRLEEIYDDVVGVRR